MKQLLIQFFFLLALTTLVRGQMPIIRANSDKADVQDGLHFKKGAIIMSAGASDNSYYIEVPRRKHRVVVRTDVDSVRFDIEYGGVYHFAVLLNNKDTAFVKLIADLPPFAKYTSANVEQQLPDTIPFHLGKNNRIYVKAKIGNEDSLNLVVDLASPITVLKTSSIKSGPMPLQIAGLHWDSTFIEAQPAGTGKNEDGVIGNGLFQDKIVKIDYDNQRIIIYPGMPEMDTTYSRHEMILNGVVPMIQAGVATKDTTCMNWFVLGTADSRNGFIDAATASQYNLYKGSNRFMTYRGRVFVKLPELRIANLSFMNVAAILAKQGTHPGEPSTLGNGLLKRFNMILDNQNGFIYLKPNTLRSAPFDNIFLKIYGIITLVVLALLTAIFFAVREMKSRRAARKQMDFAYEQSVQQEIS